MTTIQSLSERTEALRANSRPLFHDLDRNTQLDVAALKKMAEEPNTAAIIVDAQKKIFKQLDQMTEILADELSQYQNTSRQSPSGPMTGKRLMLVGRGGEFSASTRRDFARQLLIGSIINYGNLAWDPTAPATSWSAERNPSTLLSLILLGPVETAPVHSSS